MSTIIPFPGNTVPEPEPEPEVAPDEYRQLSISAAETIIEELKTGELTAFVYIGADAAGRPVFGRTACPQALDYVLLVAAQMLVAEMLAELRAEMT